MAKIVAHRGGAGLRPENTLAACAHALALGADGLEIDVRLSRDKEVVVFHDTIPDPDHVRDGRDRPNGTLPPVSDLTLRELKMLDVGHPRASKFRGTISPSPGERIPTLSELLEFLNGSARKPLLLIELKTDFNTAAPLEPHHLTEAVLDVLADQAKEDFFRLMSFDWRCMYTR